MVACGLLFGCLCGFIANAQQIFAELYGLGESFPFAFAAIALAMAAAAMTNARIVMRRGMRVVCHFALAGFVVLSVLLLLAAYLAPPSLAVFLPWLGLLFYLFGLVSPNLNAIVLEPMGEIAGLAASVLGFTTTILAAVGGWLIGSAYDGTLLPFATGFVVLSTAALGFVVVAEGPNGMFTNRSAQQE